MNRVFLIGRLGRDPELRYAQNGTAIANLRIATDESYTDRDGNKVDKVEWHTVLAFQRIAENCANYLAKGSLVAVEGSLQTRKWQDQNGQDRYSTEVKAQRIQFLSRPNEAGQGDQTPNQAPQRGANGGQRQNGNQRPPANGRSQQQAPQGAPYGGWPDDDLGPAFPSDASGMDDVPF